MLFNSYIFVLGYLPICLLMTMAIARLQNRGLYLWWLVLASIVFYGWQDPRLTLLFTASITLNYMMAAWLVRLKSSHRFLVLTLAVTANLLFIGYFKYLSFFVSSSNAIFGAQWEVARIALPLGISFYTFQQIAYLVDAYRGEIHEHSLVEYSLFVAFFPQLIAGPIVHHRDVLSQFAAPKGMRLNSADFAVGLTLFTIGLCKKVVLADGLAPFASHVFRQASEGVEISCYQAWVGAIAYSLQLYFDFSGYSDMALGLGRFFSIRLPINFDSPYKATSIVDFWRRWHITLSHFLRDYLYIPLGGNRHGDIRRNVNLMLTMLLGGLWHGAGWTFVVWGGLHGLFLIVNQSWDRLVPSSKSKDLGIWRIWAGRGLTFLAVTIAWVFFRAENLTTALDLVGTMSGCLGTTAGTNAFLARRLRDAPGWLIAGMAIVWLLPNTQQLLGRVQPALRYRYRPTAATWDGLLAGWFQWRPTLSVALWYAGMFVVSLCSFSRMSEFIYFNF